MSRRSTPSSIIQSSNVAPNQHFANNLPQLLPGSAKLTGKDIMCARIPCNGSPTTRCKINLMNVLDDYGIQRHWPDARPTWGEEALRHVRALFVFWNDPVLRLANGLYYVFGGNADSGLPVNKYFERNRYGLHGDVIILKPILDRLPDNGRVEFIHVPEELLYPTTMTGFINKINNMP